MSKTSDALVLQAASLNKLVDVITGLLAQVKVSEADKNQAKADLAVLLAEDAQNAEAAGAVTENLNKLVDLVAAAVVPAELPAI